MNFHALFGIIAAVIAFTAYPVYIFSIVKGTTRPDRVTWWILSLSCFLLAASYYASGARDTVWIALAYAFGDVVIAIFSIWYGDGQWDFMDKICLVLAVVAAGLWWLLGSPLVAFLISMGIDFLGIVPTIYKTYNKPSTESATAWIMDSIASVFSVLAIEKLTFAVVIYPVYLLLTNCILAFLTLQRKHFLKPLFSRFSWAGFPAQGQRGAGE